MDVKTTGRTVDLFEAFARNRAPLTLTEIARALGAPQSSCFNIVRALEARGYLYQVGEGKRIYPTRKLFDIVEAIAGFEPVLPRVEGLLEKLRDTTRETVIFGKRQGLKVIYLMVIEGTQTIRYISRAGELKPMHASAIGKSLLMAMPAADRAKLIAKLPLATATERTIATAEALAQDIDAAVARGWSETRGENVADVMAVALPVRIEGVDYAVAVAGPIARMEQAAADHAAQIMAIFADYSVR